MSKGLRAIWQDTHDGVSVWGGGVLLFIIALVAALQFVGPPPPDRIVIATGAEGGAYRYYGELLAARLARENIEVELRETAGSVENLALLENDNSVDLGFVQGGLAATHPTENIVTLGSLYLEPLWMFAGTDFGVESASDLDGKRIAVGAMGSGTRAVAKQLLDLNGVGPENAIFLDTVPGDLAAGFSSGDIDVAFLVGAPGSEHVARLVQSYSPYFSKVTLPEGVLDLRMNLPATDTSTVAVTAMLAARQDLHPAITDLLLIASGEVFGGHSLLADAGQFPTERYTDLPLSKEAKRFYKYGPPFLMRYLPFWAATLVDRLWVVLLPFIGLAIPLGKLLPPAHRWRIRRRLLRRYALLDTIDPFGNPVADSGDLERRLSRLKELDAESAAEIVPRSYMDDVYKLRRDIDLVRRRLTENQQSGEANQ
jgi:TRAP-type uncharacterized transport system substrate-binding protein